MFIIITQYGKWKELNNEENIIMFIIITQYGKWKELNNEENIIMLTIITQHGEWKVQYHSLKDHIARQLSGWQTPIVEANTRKNFRLTDGLV